MAIQAARESIPQLCRCLIANSLFPATVPPRVNKA